ncbi:MAG TPA: TolC family protein [Stellaceae bacterium]|jgi:outer membrane protein|nr:TolC family protein [Stellaceae bacterium]
MLAFAASPAAADSLVSTLSDTYQLNQQIAAERAAVQGKDELVPQAKSNLWRPHVVFEPQVGLTRTPQTLKDTIQPTMPGTSSLKFTQRNDNLANDRLVQINATMNVFDSGMTAAQLRQAKGLVNAERGILKQTEEQVFQSAATQYGQIVLNELLVQYAHDTMQDTARLRDLVKPLQEQHFVTVTSVTQLEEEYQGAVVSYEQAKGAAKAARAQFLAVVGRPAGKIEGFPKIEPMPAALDAGIKIALAENPTVQAARAELGAAQAAVDVVKAQLLPVFSVFGGLSHDWNNAHFLANNTLIPGGLPPHYSDTNTPSATIGLRMTMPLYQGGAEYAAVRQQIDAVLQNQRTLINTETSVRGAVETAWQTLVSARAQTTAANAQVVAAKQALDGMKRQFQDGTETITDVLTEERNLSSAQASAAQAGYSYFTAVVAFQVALGRFTAKDLKLSVPLYDPLDHYQAVKDKWIGFGAD